MISGSDAVEIAGLDFPRFLLNLAIIIIVFRQLLSYKMLLKVIVVVTSDHQK